MLLQRDPPTNADASQNDKPLVRIEHRRIPEHDLQAAHTPEEVFDFDLPQGFIAVFGAEGLEERLALGDDFGEGGC